MTGHDGMSADDRLGALELHVRAIDQHTADLSDRVAALEADVDSLRRLARLWLR